MSFYNPIPRRFQNNDAGNDGGGSDKTYTQAEVDELVAGLKNKNGELLGSQKQLKADLATMQEQLKRFDGIDPEAVHNILKRFSDDEEAKLIAEGKIDEVLNRRTERMQGAHQKQVKDLQAQLEAANKRAEQFTGRVLSDAVRAAGLDAGIHKSAVADAIFRAQGAFVVDENGELAARENALDKQGKPLTLKAWFDDMRDSAPHWFPAPQGGGLSADSGTGAKKRGGMTAQEIKAYIDRHGMQAYLKLPK